MTVQRSTKKRSLVLTLGIGALVAGALGGLVSPAHAAEGPGAVDTTTGTVPPIPGTTRTVDSWMLAGIPGVAGASGVEIAPNWILTAHHNAPSVGMPFRNWLGTSTVDAVFTPKGAQDPTSGSYLCTSTGGPDITLSHLATALPAPAGGFPSLLSDPLPSAQPALAFPVGEDALASLPGYALAAGEGGFIGHIKTVWVNTANEAVADTSQFGEAIGGDSGGPVFWYPTPTSAPILSNLMVVASPPFGQSNANLAGSCGLEPDITSFLTSVFAQYPGTSSPSFVSLDSVAPASIRLPMQAGGISTEVAGGTANSLTIDVDPAPATPGWVTPAIATYTVTLTPPSGSGLPSASTTVSAATVASSGSVVVGGLSTDVTYGTKVTTATASGLTGAPLYGPSATPRTPPNALTNVKAESYGNAQGSTVQTCVRINYAAATTGAAPNGRVLYGPGLFDVLPWQTGTNTQSIERCGLTPSKSYLWYLAPMNDNSVGPVTYVRFTTPAATTGQPIDVAVPGIGANCMLGTWTAPNAPTGGGTLQSYTLAVVNKHGSAGNTSIDVPVTTNSKLICGLPSASNFLFSVFANWDRTDVPGSDSETVNFSTSS